MPMPAYPQRFWKQITEYFTRAQRCRTGRPRDRRRATRAERLEGRSLFATLVISEINYDPHGAVAVLGEANAAASEFEFLEVMNASGATTNLAGVRLAQVPVGGVAEGVNFTFPNLTLAAGERVAVVRNLAAFRSRYGETPRVLGQWSGGSLSNQGETLTLVGPSNQVIFQVAYDSNSDWPFLAEGHGASLEIIDPAGDPMDHDNWGSSRELGGSPGQAPISPYVRRVMINEVLSHTDEPQYDSIELRNLTAQAIDIGGWFLTDNLDNPTRFNIPAGTTLPAGGFVVFDERQFNRGGGSLPNDFAISEYGEEIYLLSPAANRRPRLLEDMVLVGYTDNGRSVGNVLDVRDGRELLRLDQLTLGRPNSAHEVSSVVISEIQFYPPDDDVFKEFIELRNTTAAPVDLGLWEITDAVDYIVPAGTTLAPNSHAVIVAFNPQNAAAASAFRSYYDLAPNVPLLGPWSSNNSGEPDRLSNNGETVALRRPLLENGQTYFALAEFVTYNNVAPWPSVAVGQGATLSRVASQQYANDPKTWVATRPSPGHAVPPTAQSTVLQLDQPISASVGADGTHVRGSTDVDLYSFQAPSDGDFVFQVVGSGTAPAIPMLRLLTSDGTELARATPAGQSGVHQIQWPLLAGSSYWLVVNGMTDQPIADQPLAGTGLFAGQTGTYELTAKAAAIPSGPQHNAALPEDTNADGTVSPLDAILVINELNEARSSSSDPREGENLPANYLDVNNDGWVTPIDALSVINFLNTPPSLRAPQPSLLASSGRTINRTLTDAAAALSAGPEAPDRRAPAD